MAPVPAPPPLDAIEAVLFDLIPRLCPAPAHRGRPEILPATLLWSGLLVCLLRHTTSQQALWRLLSQAGRWHFPQVPVTAETVRIRLDRAGSATMQQLFTAVTAALAVTFPGDATLAPFAAGWWRSMKARSIRSRGPCRGCASCPPATIGCCPAR